MISGTGAALNKRGSGTQTLTGVNTFSGGVTIQNGTLSVPSITTAGVAQPLGAGVTPVVFNGTSGTLAITGSGTTDRGLTLSNGSSTLSVGGTVNMSGSITGGDSGATFTKAGAGTFNFTGSGSWTGNFQITGGAL
ncbi:MAG: autotransporter-associated beta strand repeat-containing protein [Kiritimatiellia bacterium]